jgi:2'-5' RNA ligase
MTVEAAPVPPAAAQRRRIFFALWPDPVVAGKLHRLGREAQAHCGGRPMRRDTLHLTLAFLGEVDDAGFAAALAAADEVAAATDTSAGTAAALTIDRLACWKHNHIVWAGCDEVPPPLADLASRLAVALRGRGFRLDSRPFAAHVTLLRNARCGAEPAAPQPFEWRVADFVLVESHLGADGARYEIVGRWPLAGATMPAS